MSHNYQLHSQVKQDLEEIWLHTFENWGRQQADNYIRQIMVRIQWLSEHPQSGKSRPEIKPGYYCFPEGKHLIFYTIHQDYIAIIGILHQAMDADTYFY